LVAAGARGLLGSGVELGGVEALHPKVAEALRAMSGMERLRLAHQEWALVRERLGVFLAERHPGWDASEVRREVARRLLGGSR
jgi:hypothetical protein